MASRNDPPEPTPKGPLVALVGAGAAATLMTTIALWEGYNPVGYRDIIGVPTICYGDTANVVVGKRVSREECVQRLERQIVAHTKPVLACTPRLKGRDRELVAAASLSYNIGAAAYCRSTVDRRFDAGDWRGGCNAILAWNRAGGRVIYGLQRRRQWERNLCLGVKP